LSGAQSNQKKIDSLKSFISANPKDSLKVKAYSDLCWYYRGLDTDSAFFYGNKALNLSKKIKSKDGEAQAYNDLGILYYDASNFKKSINFYRKTKVYREEVNDSMGRASIYNKLGIAYQRIFMMDSAIFFGTESLKIYEAKKHIKYAAIIKNNIANIYQDLKQYKKALNSHFEVAETYKSIGDSLGLTFSYTNIGNAYLYLKDSTKAIEFYKKGIVIAKNNEFRSELGTLYNNIGSVYKGKQLFADAIKAYNESYKIRRDINDNYGIASAIINLGGLHLDTGDIELAGAELKKGLSLAKKISAKELELTAYGSLLSYFAFNKNTDSVLVYQKLYNSVQDSIFSTRITKEVADVQEQYQTEKKEKEILSQRAEIAEKELKINKKNTQLFGLGLVAVLLSILGYLVYSQQKLKNRQLQKEAELKEAIARIETQNKLQEQRLRISRDLHDNIGAQLTFVISSIENLQYGFKIKNEKLTNKLKGIGDFTRETIYELRDTIWAMNKSEISIEDLEVRISNFMEKANEYSRDVNFNFKVDDSISKKTVFSSVKGMNIYRIIQEAINNALKYSDAKRINVEMTSFENKMKVEIQDDGSGFNIKKVEQGNGLNNMQKRAKEIDAIFNINSQVGKGTFISLVT